MVEAEREFGSLSNSELSRRIADAKRDIAANTRSYKKLRPEDGDRPGLLAAVRHYEAELIKLHAEVELRRGEPRRTEALVVRSDREFGSLSDAELSRRIGDTKRDIAANTRSYESLAEWDGDRPGLVEAVGRYDAELTRLYAEVELRRLETTD